MTIEDNPMHIRYFVITIAAIIIAAASCAIAQSLNELPMYGGIKKTSEQKDADQDYINTMVKACGSRERGAQEAAKRGWQAVYSGDLSTAMKRFNQAWLLDDKNAGAYWGFGVVLSMRGQEEQGMSMLKKAYDLAPDNARLIADLAHGYSLQGRDYLIRENKQDDALLRKADELFTKASKLEPTYGLLYANWAVAKYYHRDYKGAWKKVQRVRELGAERSLDPVIMRSLSKKMADPYKK
ncbi:MAG TPA: hypothetical protein PK350_02095 [Deltaproteobacteria bacterium]|nr:hypothetical protein [Deltaproteobacteria bacterium]HPR54480.1 hypothetical protein [Deltaproteobacteria bacterium]